MAAPLIAVITGGRYYIARRPEPATAVRGQPCCICEHRFDEEDMAFCPAYNGPICSLCCSLDARCNDACKHHARFQEQLIDWLSGVLPEPLLLRLRSRLGHFLGLLTLVTLVMAGLLTLVYYQVPVDDPAVRALMATTLAKVFAILIIISGVVAWLFVLAHESRVVAQEESQRQTRMLMAEIKAHEKTDRELQKAKELAEAANQAKSRYLTGLSHELRSPLNAAFGYAQLLEHDPGIPENRRDAVAAIRRSTGHLSDLIEGLLEISKIEAGRLELYRNRVRLRSLIDELVTMFRLQAEDKASSSISRATGGCRTGWPPTRNACARSSSTCSPTPSSSPTGAGSPCMCATATRWRSSPSATPAWASPTRICSASSGRSNGSVNPACRRCTAPAWA